MEVRKEDLLLDAKEHEPVTGNAFEDNSDSFSTDSLECKEESEGKGILLTSEKHLKEDANSAKEKDGRISGKHLCNEKESRTAVSLRSTDASVSHICRIQRSNFKRQNKRKEENPSMNNCTDLRAPYRPAGQEALREPEKHRTKLPTVVKQRESSTTKPNRPLSKEIMKNNVLLRSPRDRSLPSKKTNATYRRDTSLPARTHQCSLTKGQKNAGIAKSYLERYRLKMLETEKGETSKASTCSTFGDSSVLTLSSNDIVSICKSSSSGDELDGVQCRSDACSDTENLSSVSQVQSPRKRRSRSYVPYGFKSFQTLVVPRMGSLGPDLLSNKDQIQKLQRRKAYGQEASDRNRRIIHASRARKKVESQPSTKDTTKTRESHKPSLQIPEASAPLSSPAIRPKPEARRKRAKNINRKETKSNVQLEDLQQRHLKEVKLVELLRKNIKGSLDAV